MNHITVSYAHPVDITYAPNTRHLMDGQEVVRMVLRAITAWYYSQC